MMYWVESNKFKFWPFLTCSFRIGEFYAIDLAESGFPPSKIDEKTDWIFKEMNLIPFLLTQLLHRQFQKIQRYNQSN